MLAIKEQKKIKEQALKLFERAKIPLTAVEKSDNLKIVEFGNRDFYKMGLVMLTFINTDFYGGRYILFFPDQFCPLHIHPDIEDGQGKIETFRVLYGKVIKYSAKKKSSDILVSLSAPELEDLNYENKIVLKPGDQSQTLIDERHWYKAGKEGAISMEISTPLKYEEFDVWTDKTSYPEVY